MSKIKTENNYLERRRPTFLRIGLIAGLAFALMAFEYTTYGPQYLRFDDDIEIIDIDEEIVAIKKMEKEEVRQDEPEPMDKKEKKPTSLLELEIAKEIKTEEARTSNPPDRPKAPTAPTPVVLDPPEGPDGPLDFIPVGNMPYYETCGVNTPAEERQLCTVAELQRYVTDHLRMPNDFDGRQKAYVYFEVDKKGRISNVKLLNEVSYGLENELLRVFNEMPEMVPGHQRMKPVSVIYRMPIVVIRN